MYPKFIFVCEMLLGISVFYTLWGVKETASYYAIGVLAVCFAILNFVGQIKRYKYASIFAQLFLIVNILLMGGYGNVSFKRCRDVQADFFVASIARNTERLALFMERMDKFNIHTEAIFGFDMKDKAIEDIALAYNVSLDRNFPDYCRAELAIFLSNRVAFTKMMNSPMEWLLLFEDDAYIYPSFLKSLSLAICENLGADLIWLDTRNAASWYFLRRLDGGTAGMLMRKSSIQRIIDLMSMHSKHVIEAIDTYNPCCTNDVYYAHLCNVGVLKCGFAPLVRESGIKTSVSE
jgi:hypothetical protein